MWLNRVPLVQGPSLPVCSQAGNLGYGCLKTGSTSVLTPTVVSRLCPLRATGLKAGHVGLPMGWLTARLLTFPMRVRQSEQDSLLFFVFLWLHPTYSILPLCHILFLKCKSLGLVHTRGKRVTHESEDQEGKWYRESFRRLLAANTLQVSLHAHFYHMWRQTASGPLTTPSPFSGHRRMPGSQMGQTGVLGR